MSNLPDFTNYGYQVVRELGYNLGGGRVTYLAKRVNTQEHIVIKQFQFARSHSWSAFKAYEREIEVLQGLNHRGIPRYLDSFETPSGFCMVQEYKNAQSLAVKRSFDPEEIKQIAVSILEILVYLQNRIPLIIHRDIKPENILVDADINVYLIDFGFARIGSHEVAMSSIALGTLGFMAPEQLYNRKLTEATDLYGLGATLICLLTGTKSTAMDILIDEDGRITFRHLLPKLSPRFINWLEKMIQPKPKDRFANAETALKALKPLYINRLPELILSVDNLEFRATKIGEKLTQAIAISNIVPETILEGKWEVAPHPSDPPHTPESHAWIHFTPASFQGNETNICMTVDTSKLMVDKVYLRQILLHTNSLPETRTITVKVKTVPLPISKKKLSYTPLALLLLTSYATAGIGATATALVTVAIMAALVARTEWDEIRYDMENDWYEIRTMVRATAGSLTQFLHKAVAVGLVLMLLTSVAKTVPLISVVAGFVVLAVVVTIYVTVLLLVLATILVMTVFAVRVLSRFVVVAQTKIWKPINPELSHRFRVLLLLLAPVFGGILGTGLKVGLLNPWILFAVALTGSIFIGVIYPHLARRKLVTEDSQSEEYLIKP
ncbi:MAG: serine/threonine-protein kinase [Scytonema sp. PMC 1069.18]|nr:serine/threonine-protein kinase [Scytonema sp. PMC 1069.18]MEC4882387.1 serine/threonine-protein kinase [Scytonema sp. PMC 1070.18]